MQGGLECYFSEAQLFLLACYQREASNKGQTSLDGGEPELLMVSKRARVYFSHFFCVSSNDGFLILFVTPGDVHFLSWEELLSAWLKNSRRKSCADKLDVAKLSDEHNPSDDITEIPNLLMISVMFIKLVNST